jgi:hypothetical protein
MSVTERRDITFHSYMFAVVTVHAVVSASKLVEDFRIK